MTKEIGKKKEISKFDQFLLTNLIGTPVPFEQKIKPPQKYREQMKSEIKDNSWKDTVICPKWFLDLFRKGASDEQIFEAMLKELRNRTTRENLRLAQLLFNEIGKTKKGVELLKKKLTPELIREIQKRGNPNAC